MIKDAQSLNPGKIVELFILDLGSSPGAPTGYTNTLHMSGHALGFNSGPLLGGVEFNITSIALSGITLELGGKIPEPTLKIQLSEVGILKDFLNNPLADIRGAKVTRIVINEKYLDHGATPNTDPANYITQTFFINQVYELMQHMVTFKLSTAMGLDSLNDKVNRTLSSNQCNKKYRVWNIATSSFKYVSVEDGGCEWGQAGEQAHFSYCPSWGTPYIDAQDEPTANAALDRCSMSIAGCKKRFPITDGTQAFPISINLKGGMK